MIIGFSTNKPEYTSEMADIVRLFYGEIQLVINPKNKEERDVFIEQKIIEKETGWHFECKVNGKNKEKKAVFPAENPVIHV